MDPSSNYVLTTGGGTINFNTCEVNDATNCYFLTEITGLDGAPIRNPMDNAPITDGGLIHNFYEGPLHPVFAGSILIQSTRVDDTIQQIRNDMVRDLRNALRSILRADGTLTWTEAGVGNHSLTVRYEQPLSITGLEMLAFTFGLASESSTPSTT
jgi:hypothetical protein